VADDVIDRASKTDFGLVAFVESRDLSQAAIRTT
jgi:hypothetical protein